VFSAVVCVLCSSVLINAIDLLACVTLLTVQNSAYLAEVGRLFVLAVLAWNKDPLVVAMRLNPSLSWKDAIVVETLVPEIQACCGRSGYNLAFGQ
jgi:hypothetical protein